MSDASPTDNPVQNIILDTCVLQYLSDKYMSLELLKFLLDLIQRGFGLAISDISIFELLQDATIKKENEGVDTLKLFGRYNLLENTLIASAQISTLYKSDRCHDGISVADKIIGATAILSGSLILTADINDYPRPFFNEVEEKLLIYRKNNKSNMISMQILRPNIVYINQRFLERPKT
jgi:predicted nucleic acid-binding protein